MAVAAHPVLIDVDAAILFSDILIVPFAYLLSVGALDWGPLRQVWVAWLVAIVAACVRNPSPLWTEKRPANLRTATSAERPPNTTATLIFR